MLVFAVVPAIIYGATALTDTVFRLTVIPNTPVRLTIIAVLLVIGMIYGLWSILIQNIVGRGGPVEIGNVEISPKTKTLVVSGPYRNSRNPMLLGTFLAYLAFALFINSITAVALVCALIVFMLNVVVKMEEARLLKDFGSRYEEYRRRVSKLFPWFQRKN